MTTDVIAECTLGLDSLRLTSGASGLQLHAAIGGAPTWTASFGDDVRLLHAAADGPNLAIHYRPYPDVQVSGHGTLDVSVTARLELGGRISLTLDAPGDYPLAELRGPVLTPAPSVAGQWSFLVPDGEGLLLRGDGTGPGQRPRVTFHDHRITLPMTALVAAGGAALLVSAAAGHDHAVDLVPGPRPGLALVSLAAFGAWSYPRRWRIAALPSGGLAAVAAEMSRELKLGGLELRNRSDKVRDIPERVRDSMGGTVVWAHFDTLTATLVHDLESAGLREVRLMGRPADHEAQAALLAGRYASGPYFQTYDVFPSASVEELGWRGTYPPEGASDGWPGDLIRDMAGWLDPAWMYLPFPRGTRFWRTEQYLGTDGTPAIRRHFLHDQVQVRSYRRCPSRHRAVIQRRALPMLDAIGATTIFFDIATAMWGFECYDPRHPCDRRQDVGYRREALATLAATGRPVFSEAGKWWAIDDVNGFEGLLSYDQELNEDCMQLTDYPEDPARRSAEFNLEHRVPLFGMVARHAVSRTMWWGTGQDRHAATWPSKDAITALFGANPIFVVDPDHLLTPGAQRWQRFLRTARAFDTFAELTGDASIASYETSGSQVGRTQFNNGASVEANVGFTASDGLAPGQFIIRDSSGRAVVVVDPTSDE